jgi:alkylation response protein AidB-like acyl-CoA dehydrogenase
MLRGEKKVFFGLSEPSGGSDPARAIQTRAVRDGDEWVLNGTKLWMSGADRAAYGLVFARTGPDKGRAGDLLHCGNRLAGFSGAPYRTRCARPNTPQKFTWRICASRTRISGTVGGGCHRQRSAGAPAHPYAAECLAVAIKAHEMAVAYAKIRETFGAPLASRQGIQWMLVDNEIDIRTARLLVLDAAAKAERGEPFRTESAMAKLVAAEASGRVVDRSMQIHGG